MSDVGKYIEPSRRNCGLQKLGSRSVCTVSTALCIHHLAISKYFASFIPTRGVGADGGAWKRGAIHSFIGQKIINESVYAIQSSEIKETISKQDIPEYLFS